MYEIPLIFYGEQEAEYGTSLEKSSSSKVSETLFNGERIFELITRWSQS